MEKFDLVPLLDYIDPAMLDYNGWVQVGMALKHEDTVLTTGTHGLSVIPPGIMTENAKENGTVLMMMVR